MFTIEIAEKPTESGLSEKVRTVHSSHSSIDEAYTTLYDLISVSLNEMKLLKDLYIVDSSQKIITHLCRCGKEWLPANS